MVVYVPMKRPSRLRGFLMRGGEPSPSEMMIGGRIGAALSGMGRALSGVGRVGARAVSGVGRMSARAMSGVGRMGARAASGVGRMGARAASGVGRTGSRLASRPRQTNQGQQSGNYQDGYHQQQASGTGQGTGVGTVTDARGSSNGFFSNLKRTFAMATTAHPVDPLIKIVFAVFVAFTYIYFWRLEYIEAGKTNGGSNGGVRWLSARIFWQIMLITVTMLMVMAVAELVFIYYVCGITSFYIIDVAKIAMQVMLIMGIIAAVNTVFMFGLNSAFAGNAVDTDQRRRTNILFYTNMYVWIALSGLFVYTLSSR